MNKQTQHADGEVACLQALLLRGQTGGLSPQPFTLLYREGSAAARRVPYRYLTVGAASVLSAERLLAKTLLAALPAAEPKTALLRAAIPLMREAGYDPVHAGPVPVAYYAAQQPHGDDCGCVRLDRRLAASLVNDTGAAWSDAWFAGGGICYAVIENGHIVSAALLTAPRSEAVSGFCEIGVQTAPAFRNRGYAARCVSTLCRTLCGTGRAVLYRTRCDNAASCRTAERAGLLRIATATAPVFQRREAENADQYHGGI